jgi:hypothetical protein
MKKDQITAIACIILALVLAISMIYSLDLRDTTFGRAVNWASAVVGMSASVRDNEYNTLAVQLREKEESLNEMERALAERLSKESVRQQRLTIAFTLVSGLLLSLILINFFQDWKRNREKTGEQK